METIFQLIAWWECRKVHVKEMKIEYWLQCDEWRFRFAADMQDGLRRGTVFSFQPYSFIYNVKRLRYFVHSALKDWEMDYS